MQQLKEYLKDNPEVVISLLEELGCHDFKWQPNGDLRCALPDGDNYTSVRIKFNEYLGCTVFSRPDYKGRDIIDLVAYIKKIHRKQAIQWLCQYTNTTFNEDKPIIPSYKIFNQFKPLPLRKHDECNSHQILDLTILDMYEPYVYNQWINEGILPHIQKQFNIRLDKQGKRVIIPIYDENNNLINLKGRSLIQDYKPKYIYYFPVGTPDILFGLNLSVEFIKQQNEVIIFEAEKSVMKAYSYGIYNVVAVGTHSITEYQLRKLLKLKANIVIAFDKDVGLKYIRQEVEQLKWFTNVYVIIDRFGVLDEKDAPIDKGIEIFQKLYHHKIKI